MGKTYIYVNRDNVVDNARDGGKRPVITVLQGKDARDVKGVEIDGPSRVVYSDTKTLMRGYDTRVWVETDAPVRVL